MQSPVLSFARLGLGRTVALLNEAPVGEIVEAVGHARFRFMWKCGLDQLGGAVEWRCWHSAATAEAAMRRLEDRVNEWLCRAGILDPGAGVRCAWPVEEEA